MAIEDMMASDDVMAGYANTLQQRNERDLMTWGKPDGVVDEKVEEADEEIELTDPYAFKVTGSVPEVATTEAETQEPEKSLIEQGWDMLPEAGQKIVWPFLAPFVKGSREENPIVRGMVSGIVEDAPNGILNLARDFTNAVGGDFKEEDWIKVPQILQSNPDSTTEGVVRGLSQFMSVFGAAGGISKGANLFRQTLAGGMADATFDPTEGNLGTLLRELNVDNSLTQFLDSKVGEDATTEERLVARAKNVLEGAGIGFAVPGLIKGIKWMKENSQPFIGTLLDKVDDLSRQLPETQMSANFGQTNITSIDDLIKQNPSTTPKIPVNKVFKNDSNQIPRSDKVEAEKILNNEKELEKIKYTDIDVEDIIPTQKNINVNNLKDVENLTDAEDAVTAIEYNGKYYLADGHHRVANAILNNENKVPVKVISATGGAVSIESQAQEKQVRNVRNNNPGNIKDFGDKWEGMTGTDSGGNVAEGSFVKFESPELGVRALTKDITNKRRRGLNTVEKILKVYAPEGRENNLQAYIDDVTSDLGIKPNTKLRDKNMFALIKAITKHEGGKDSLSHFTDDVIMSGMSMAYPKRYRKA